MRIAELYTAPRLTSSYCKIYILCIYLCVHTCTLIFLWFYNIVLITITHWNFAVCRCKGEYYSRKGTQTACYSGMKTRSAWLKLYICTCSTLPTFILPVCGCHPPAFSCSWHWQWHCNIALLPHFYFSYMNWSWMCTYVYIFTPLSNNGQTGWKHYNYIYISTYLYHIICALCTYVCVYII